MRLTAAAIASAFAGGCSTESIIDAGPGAGHVILLPGVEGNAWQLSEARRGLREAGFDWTIEIIPWGSPPFSSYANLTNIRMNRRRAERIAARVAERRAAAPDAPLVLVGYSGGGGLAMLTAEVLPDGVMLDRIVLIAAAISNRYDPAAARRHCRDELINFYSAKDGIVGWGTSLLGTIDRKRSISAGHSGFLEADGSLLHAPRLRQIGWDRSWRAAGHDGSHIGYLFGQWSGEFLAPAILGALNADFPAPSTRPATATAAITPAGPRHGQH